MKKFWKTKMGKPASPDDGELLAFLDGELPPLRQAELRQLLENDWSLRVRLGELECDIAAYVRATQSPANADAPPFDDLWRKVSAHAQQDEVAPPLRWQRAQMWMLQPVQLRLALSAGTVLLLAAGLVFWLLRSERVSVVSAEELMQRATQSEAKSSQRVGDPVVYRKVQLRRAGSVETVQWESWKDARQTGQFRQRIANERLFHGNDDKRPALLAELETILQANQFDAERPLSAVAFANWRKQLRQFSDTVTDQRESWRLMTVTAAPHSLNVIKAASLLVRKSDWHALSLQLQVQGENEVREYELIEIAYDVLPLQALTVFADLAPTPASATPAPSIVAAMASPAPSASLPSAAALQEAEVAALYALHQLQADLGEQLEVVREGNHQIIVRGLVEQSERKQQLTAALRAIPLVTPQIQTIQEAARQLKPSNAVPAENTVAVESTVTATPQVNVFQQRLEQQFRQRGLDRNRASQQSAELSNAVVAEARAALSEAWAVRRLSERFQSGEAQPRIAEMMRNHTARLRARQRQLQTQLEPLLIGIGGTVAPVTPVTPDTMPQRVRQVFQSVEQLHSLTNSLFAGAGSDAGTAEISARRLLTALQQLDSALRNFEQ
jgi:hypothetical protein